MVPSRKLAILATVFVAAVAYVAYLGATSGWQYYLTAEECSQRGAALVNCRVRVSGRVAPGSLTVEPDDVHSTFALQAAPAQVLVSCDRPLPEQLTDDKEVVVEGRVVAPGSLAADRIITRCATKYQSRSPHDASPDQPSRAAVEAGP